MKNQNSTPNKLEQDILLPLQSFYTSPDKFELYTIDSIDKTLRNVLTWETKPLENEKSLLDMLLGKETFAFNKYVIDDLRNLFGITKQAGFLPDPPYNFRFSKNANKTYALKMFMDIQEKYNTTQEYINFEKE